MRTAKDLRPCSTAPWYAWRGILVRPAITRLAAIVALLLMTVPRVSAAQQHKTGNVPRVGYLFLQPWSATGHLPATRSGRDCKSAATPEGQNIAIDFRNAEGRPDRLPDLAAELVQIKVDVIVAAPDASIQAAQQATRTIPVVMAVSFDPVRRGFVASLARPGGNIAGLATVSPELTPKRLELLKEMVPTLSEVAVLWDDESPSEADQLKQMEIAARALRVSIVLFKRQDSLVLARL